MSKAIELLAAAPFHLSKQDISWVEKCLNTLTGRRRLAQLFNVILQPNNTTLTETLVGLQPGGITQFTIGGLDAAMIAAQALDRKMDIPLLISADLEGGAICLDGTTPMPNQLGMAALPSAKDYERALDVMASEGKAIGINWSFTPVVDVNAEFRSTVVGTRSFGSKKGRVLKLGKLHVQTIQRQGLAATAKHWPGEGFDARDQHLVTTVNPLSLTRWRSTFGRIYRQMIDSGVLTIMTGHIAMPAYAHSKGVTGLEAYRPASISTLLNVDLLRGEFGFNGLITSDATEMGGLSSWSARAEYLPEVIQNGCDMILFASDIERDIAILEKAIADGRLTEDRVDEALIRVLGLKAKLGLNRKAHRTFEPEEARKKLRTPANLAVGKRVASRCVTLVKDVNGLLPIKPEKHRRILLISDPNEALISPFPQKPLVLEDELKVRGFEVTAYQRGTPISGENTDLVLYVLAQESLLTSGAIYLDWRRIQGSMGDAMRRVWHEIPTILISFGHPYYLNDAPRMPCLINAYTSVETVQHAVIRKLVGEDDFYGTHPVDAFCGLEDARY